MSLHWMSPFWQRWYIQPSCIASAAHESVGMPPLLLPSPGMPVLPGMAQAGSAQGSIARSTQVWLHTLWQQLGSSVHTHVSVSWLPQPGVGATWQQLASGGGSPVTSAGGMPVTPLPVSGSVPVEDAVSLPAFVGSKALPELGPSPPPAQAESTAPTSNTRGRSRVPSIARSIPARRGLDHRRVRRAVANLSSRLGFQAVAAQPGEEERGTMPNHETAGAEARPVWMFMAATAMATTISTLTATAMVKADATEPTAVTCACEAPAAVPVFATPPASPEPPVVAAEPRVVSSDDEPAPKAEVIGALDKDLIRRIVRAHIDEVRYCYDEGLSHDPELSGSVIVQFVIGSEGKVTRSTARSEMEGEVPECIAKAVGRWMFPRPADGEDVVVSYPFVLEPG
jgi:hypothetical protein